MAAMAGMLHSKGFTITGSDQNVYPPMSDFLDQLGIKVMQGYSGENLDPRPDLVIVGNVVRADNPEAIRLAAADIPYLSMPQALGDLFLADRIPLIVTGTHGKTTTASLLATSLHRAGSTPGFMIGGIVEAFGRNFNLSDLPYFVVEGDEYDTAFFNKVSKFHHYRPNCAILTSIEFDHADIFADLEEIKATFTEFIGRIPVDGLLVANIDDPVVAELSKTAQCQVVTYGLGHGCQWQLRDLEVSGLASRFSVFHNNIKLGSCSVPMPGRHNCLNALSVIALMSHLGYDYSIIRQSLASFEGIKRRQQIRGRVAGVTVIDDFAHHPTAVRETVNALRLAWPDNRLLVVFEPRTNSSRRAIFQHDYAAAFDQADQILIREHVPLTTIPLDQQFSSSQLTEDLISKGLDAKYFAGTDEILDYLIRDCKAGDIVAILSNGGFDNIHQRLVGMLGEMYPCGNDC